MHSIMTKVDSIRFAQDYNILTQVEKTKWLNEAYVRAHPIIFEDVDLPDIPVVMAENDVAVWKAQMGRQTMARNRLYQLFLNVSQQNYQISFSTLILIVVWCYCYY